MTLGTISELRVAYNQADAERIRVAGELYDALCNAKGVPHVHFGGGAQPDAWSGVWRHDSDYAQDLMRERLLRELQKPITVVEGVTDEQ